VASFFSNHPEPSTRKSEKEKRAEESLNLVELALDPRGEKGELEGLRRRGRTKEEQKGLAEKGGRRPLVRRQRKQLVARGHRGRVLKGRDDEDSKKVLKSRIFRRNGYRLATTGSKTNA